VSSTKSTRRRLAPAPTTSESDRRVQSAPITREIAERRRRVAFCELFTDYPRKPTSSTSSSARPAASAARRSGSIALIQQEHPRRLHLASASSATARRSCSTTWRVPERHAGERAVARGDAARGRRGHREARRRRGHAVRRELRRRRARRAARPRHHRAPQRGARARTRLVIWARRCLLDRHDRPRHRDRRRLKTSAKHTNGWPQSSRSLGL
jgi:hypothetical protein